MATRKRAARGLVAPKGPGKHMIRWSLGKGPDGKRQYASKTIIGSRKDAEAALTKELRDMDMGVGYKPTNLTVAEYLDRWIVQYDGITRRTRDCYKERLVGIKARLGHHKLSELTPSMVMAYYTYMRDKQGLADRTRQLTHAVLNNAFKCAQMEGVLGVNPCSRVKAPTVSREHKNEMKYLSPAQVGTLLSKSREDSLYALWHLLVTSGLRPGEALALKWEDLSDLTITVRRSLMKVTAEDGKVVYEVVTGGKTKGAVRNVLLDEDTVAVLRAHKVTQSRAILSKGAAYDRQDLVFANALGRPLDPHNVLKRWKRALRSAGLPEIRLYDARHSNATAMLGAGIHAKVAAERLGHTDPAMFMKTYSHVTPEMREDSAQKIGALFAVAMG